MKNKKTSAVNRRIEAIDLINERIYTVHEKIIGSVRQHIYTESVKRLSIEFCKIQTKAITTANPKKRKCL